LSWRLSAYCFPLINLKSRFSLSTRKEEKESGLSETANWDPEGLLGCIWLKSLCFCTWQVKTRKILNHKTKNILSKPNFKLQILFIPDSKTGKNQKIPGTTSGKTLDQGSFHFFMFVNSCDIQNSFPGVKSVPWTVDNNKFFC
jgi:hypothetical protein